MAKKCKGCGRIVSGRHYCPTEQRTVEYEEDDFLLSMAVGYATNSTMLGGMVGGNFMGAALGDMLNDSEDKTPDIDNDRDSGPDPSDNDSDFGSDDSGSSGSDD